MIGTGRSIYYSKTNLVALAKPLVRAASPTGEEKVLLELMEIDRGAIASLDAGEPVIPIWLEKIYQRVVNQLKS